MCVFVYFHNCLGQKFFENVQHFKTLLTSIENGIKTNYIVLYYDYK